MSWCLVAVQSVCPSCCQWAHQRSCPVPRKLHWCPYYCKIYEASILESNFEALLSSAANHFGKICYWCSKDHIMVLAMGCRSGLRCSRNMWTRGTLEGAQPENLQGLVMCFLCMLIRGRFTVVWSPMSSTSCSCQLSILWECSLVFERVGNWQNFLYCKLKTKLQLYCLVWLMSFISHFHVLAIANPLWVGQIILLKSFWHTYNIE